MYEVVANRRVFGFLFTVFSTLTFSAALFIVVVIILNERTKQI